MKKHLSVLIGICLIMVCLTLLGIDTWAAEVTASGTCGENLTWTLDAEGLLTISGSGPMDSYSDAKAQPWYNQQSRIQRVVISDGVINIGRHAFYGCSNLTSVTIPNSITAIGDSAFNSCGRLSGIILPEGVTTIGGGAFEYCTALTSIVIPEGVTVIQDCTFLSCTNLRSVTLPDGILSIESNAFFQCYCLTDITIPESVTHIGSKAFYKCKALPGINLPDGITAIYSETFGNAGLQSVTIPNGVTSIGKRAFDGCSNLTTLILPDSVTDIGEHAFSSCTGLQSVTISENLKHIGGYGFFNCENVQRVDISNLAAWLRIEFDTICANPLHKGGSLYIGGELVTDVVVPEGITKIQAYAFDNYDNLKSITLSNSVTGIGMYAFDSCDNLDTIYIPQSLTSIDQYAFRYCGDIAVHIEDVSAWLRINFENDNSNPLRFGKGLYINNEPITEVTIPGDITTIAGYAFYSCSSLVSVTIGDNVTGIGHSAFSGCGISSITIPDSVISIGGTAFAGCRNLTAITIPDSVTSMGSSVFSACTSLTSVTLPASIGSISIYMFNACSALTTFTVPDGITGIGASAFNNCTSLASITIADSVTSIGTSAFFRCSSLTSVVIPEGVTRIKSGTFEDCTGLTSVHIPEGVTTIEREAFLNCAGLTSVHIPASVTEIAVFAFDGCTSLKGFFVSEDNQNFCNDAFGVLYDKTKTRLVRAPGEIAGSYVIADGVTVIDQSAFSDCVNLTSVVIPEGITVINVDTFYHCSSLVSVIIPEGVTKIYSGAFEACSSLTSVVIPEGVTEIDGWAFRDCTSLTSIVIPKSVAYFRGNVFANCTSLTEISFMGSAPYVSETNYTNVYANVYYPCGDSTWTFSVRQGFGTTLNWFKRHDTSRCELVPATCTSNAMLTGPCGGCGGTVFLTQYNTATGHSYEKGVCTACGEADPDYVPVRVPTLTLSYPTLSFEDEIRYNIYYTLNDAAGIAEMGLITFGEKLVDGTMADAVDVIPGFVGSGDTYMAQTNGILARNLGDALYFKVYAKLTDGSYVYSEVGGYHAVAYANTVLNSADTSPKAKALVVAMLNYGAEAQTFFGYKTDSLMNANLTAEQQALAAAYNETMVQDVVKADASKAGSFVMNGGYSDIYPTVSFEGAFSINYYFTPSRSVDAAPTLYYWDAKTYASVDVLTPENATGVLTMAVDGSNWGAAVEGITAKALDDTIYVAGFYTSDGVSYPTGIIAYSLGNYCKTIAANGEAFGAAAAVYGYYAKAYFA